MTDREWRPTWRPEALEPGLVAWLALEHTPTFAQDNHSARESRTHPDYLRYQHMLTVVTREPMP